MRHRFEKATYLYIYYNATRQISRLEVANGPGTPEQDAFNGYLEDCSVVNSYRFPSLVTLVVGSPSASSSSSGARSPTTRDPDEWRLASADPRDQGKQKYRLHTLDIYFWTAEDAKQVTDLFKRLLHPSQLDIVESEKPPEPQAQQHEDVNPVVRNLENVAISDPAYRDGRTRNSQNQPQTQASPLPPAPTNSRGAAAQSPSPVSEMSSVGRADSTKPQDPAAFTPMAYNPAAPPAPEPIAHREKTPPPQDAADGTGLGAAVHDAPYQPGKFQSNTPNIPGAPGPVPGMFGHYGSPPPQSFGSPPPQASTQSSPSHARASTASGASSFAPPPSGLSQTTSHQSSIAQQYAPPPKDQFAYGQDQVETPGTQFYNSLGGQEQRHQSLTHVHPQYPDYLSARPQPPVGGYSDYQYHQSGQPPQGSGPGDIHSQVYRPTEDEAHGHKSSRRTSSAQKPNRFDQSAEKIEKKAGSWLKKLEKKIG